METIEDAKKQALAESRERLGSMCGYCVFWRRLKMDRYKGKRVGMCSMTGQVMDRCEWCIAEEERKNALNKNYC